jgi:hypothetical protein
MVLPQRNPGSFQAEPWFCLTSNFLVYSAPLWLIDRGDRALVMNGTGLHNEGSRCKIILAAVLGLCHPVSNRRDHPPDAHLGITRADDRALGMQRLAWGPGHLVASRACFDEVLNFEGTPRFTN